MVTASVVTYRTPVDEVERAIRLAEQSIIDRLYVVDNSRSEAIRQACAGHEATVEYIASDNVGYGAAHNKALRKATARGSRYHLVMNTDIVCRSDDVSLLAAYMDSNPDTATVQPRIVNEDGSLQYTVRQLPTPFDVFARRFLPSALIRRSDDRYLLKDVDHDKAFNVPYHQGSFMFLRMDAVAEAGLFDERFFMYPEDIDLTRRLHTIGATMYWPGVTVVHCHRAASYHNLRMLRIHCINMIRYFNKWGWFFDRQRRQFNDNIRKATR